MNPVSRFVSYSVTDAAMVRTAAIKLIRVSILSALAMLVGVGKSIKGKKFNVTI